MEDSILARREGREIDFVIVRNREEIDAIECKWDRVQFDPKAMKVFRSYYPRGKNYLLSPLTITGYTKKVSGLDIYVCKSRWLAEVFRRTRASEQIKQF